MVCVESVRLSPSDQTHWKSGGFMTAGSWVVPATLIDILNVNTDYSRWSPWTRITNITRPPRDVSFHSQTSWSEVFRPWQTTSCSYSYRHTELSFFCKSFTSSDYKNRIADRCSLLYSKLSSSAYRVTVLLIPKRQWRKNVHIGYIRHLFQCC
jgi:hypothetical protein